jgi:hypothetical protein
MASGHLSMDETSHDSWLRALRAEPSQVFKAELRERLRAQEPVAGPREWPGRALVAAGIVMLVGAAISVPAVRASVARFVSLFRVVNFVAVPVDASRIDRLKAEDLQIDTLVGEHVQVIEDPGPPVQVASLADAAAAVRMPVATPQWLPNDTRIIETAVVGERALRVTGSSERLQQVMDALGITDLSVPPGLDGHVVDVRVPPVVMIRYDHQGKRRTRLFQARTPQIALPDGVDLQALGEIGLRILGLPAQEASQFAHAIDWHTTLVVPVPPNATSFQQIDINGRQGVLIQSQPRDQSPTTTIVWSTPDRVFALVSIEHVSAVTAMATSVR